MSFARSAIAPCLVCLFFAAGCGSGDLADEWGEEHQRLHRFGEARSNDPEEIEFALERLKNGTASVRAVAAWALGEARREEAAPALRDALDDRNENVRANAVVALFTLAVDDWPAIARRGLEDDASFVQQATLSAIPEPLPSELVEAIGALLAGEKDEVVRAGAADALGSAGGGDAVVDALAAGAADESKDVRTHVAFALGRVENSRAVPVLAGLLDDESWEVRANACQALGHYRTAEAQAAIARALEDEHGQVRAVALRLSER